MKKVPEELAEKLLKASTKMPDGSGFDVSIDEVSSLAGVPRATLYYYFSGKEDLVGFYLNDLMDRTRGAIEQASAGEGDSSERLAGIMEAIIASFAAYPKMCLELPHAIRGAGDFSELMINMDRSMMAPFRDVLLEGRGAGELEFKDVGVAVDAIAGALHMVSMKALLTEGKIDVEKVASAVVPQLINGLIPRN